MTSEQAQTILDAHNDPTAWQALLDDFASPTLANARRDIRARNDQLTAAANFTAGVTSDADEAWMEDAALNPDSNGDA